MNLARLSFRSFCTTTILRSKRDNVYGVEEGHGTRNEVRSEKWIRKQKLRSQTKGEAWRTDRNYESSVQKFTLPLSNWSDADQDLPGPPSNLQKLAKINNLKLAQDIFDAAQLVQRAKNLPEKV